MATALMALTTSMAAKADSIIDSWNAIQVETSATQATGAAVESTR